MKITSKEIKSKQNLNQKKMFLRKTLNYSLRDRSTFCTSSCLVFRLPPPDHQQLPITSSAGEPIIVLIMLNLPTLAREVAPVAVAWEFSIDNFPIAGCWSIGGLDQLCCPYTLLNPVDEEI